MSVKIVNMIGVYDIYIPELKKYNIPFSRKGDKVFFREEYYPKFQRAIYLERQKVEKPLSQYKDYFTDNLQ